MAVDLPVELPAEPSSAEPSSAESSSADLPTRPFAAEDLQYLGDILHSCQRILEYVADSDLETFRAEVAQQDAVLKRLLAISKKAQRVSPAGCRQLMGIPWGELRSLQRQLVEAERPGESDVLWTLIHHEIPALIRAIAPYFPSAPTPETTARDIEAPSA